MRKLYILGILVGMFVVAGLLYDGYIALKLLDEGIEIIIAMTRFMAGY